MRRRTKPRVVWLPPDNLNSIDSTTDLSGIQAFRVDNAPNATKATGEIPLVIDAPVDLFGGVGAQGASLADVESSGYRLRRIVGKIWIRMDQADDANINFNVVTAGIIVRRVDTTGVSLALGSLESEVSTQDIRAYGDPWIWRRSWILYNNQSPNAFPLNGPGPETNYGPDAGSVSDGPHVDQKTARLIGPEERLFLDVSVQANAAPNLQDEIPVSTLIITDLRVLASMRSSSGNRRNASR